jgi:hypothetical protein
MRALLDDVMNTQGTWIKVYLAKETIQDPYEKNVTVVYSNPISIRAIVEDLTATQAQWKMPGIKVAKVKDVFVEVKHQTLLEKSAKIEYKGETYEGWRENGKCQFRDQPGIGNGTGYLRLYIYSKVV